MGGLFLGFGTLIIFYSMVLLKQNVLIILGWKNEEYIFNCFYIFVICLFCYMS